MVNKETWDDACKNCRMPALLHKGVCTRQDEAVVFEYDKILDERDKFNERMKPIIRFMAEQEEKVTQNNEQYELVMQIKNLVGTMNARESKAAKIVKPARVPVWTEKMTLGTYEKALEVWINQNRDMSENARLHEVVELLKVNKEVKGLAEYVAVYILPVLDTVEKQTVRQVYDKLKEKYGRTRMEEVEELVMEWMEFKPNEYEKAEEYWFAMERMFTKMEEKKVERKEWFSVWMMVETKRRKGMETFELQEMRNVVKEGGVEVMNNLKNKFRELKIEGNREQEVNVYYMGKESVSRLRYHEQRRRGELQDRDWQGMRRNLQGREYYQDRRGRDDSRGRPFFRRYDREELKNPRDFSRDRRSHSRSFRRESEGRSGSRGGYRRESEKRNSTGGEYR